MVQDEALYKCYLLFFEEPPLEAQLWRVVPKYYLSLGGILGGVSKLAPYGYTRWISSARCARGTNTPPRIARPCEG